VNPTLGNLTDLFKHAGKIRELAEKARESLGRLEVEGASGGGEVVAKVNGRFELLAIRIDPKLLASGDHELVEDLLVAAVNQAMAKAREEAARSMQGLGGGLPIPDLSSLFGSLK
jgi:DNA-binding YbaB/EbfC family protein